MIIFTILLTMTISFAVINNWNLSNTSSIVTLFLFILYIYGRIWRLKLILESKYDNYELINVSDDERAQLQIKNNYIEIIGNTITEPNDLSIYKLTTAVKVRKIRIFKTLYDVESNGDKFIPIDEFEFRNLEPNSPLFIAMEPSETIPCHFFEFQYIDYSKTSYYVSEDGSGGSVICKDDYKTEPTFLTYLYYLVM